MKSIQPEGFDKAVADEMIAGEWDGLFIIYWRRNGMLDESMAKQILKDATGTDDEKKDRLINLACVALSNAVIKLKKFGLSSKDIVDMLENSAIVSNEETQ